MRAKSKVLFHESKSMSSEMVSFDLYDGHTVFLLRNKKMQPHGEIAFLFRFIFSFVLSNNDSRV